ncbi:type II toxin-antitoxin system PemK/MazF family toxin [Limosilactobacillus kribbianus]|uniref:type II toxin-antitoxin system PemK/MazF family toxin n=1 Tax=Limosilactobacillus kribbianus TaxID=2982695 RepID=UPI002264A00B|nr:type II toxin-antitoxin system PemK/MazF family toxin [Limosilactobacillus kribbianus]
MALSELPYGRGDIILVSNDSKPKNNNEQKGLRSWLVVSRKLLNENGPFVWAIPFTTTEREYPLAYDWTKKGPNTKTYGTLLCDQLVTLDVTHRWTKLVEQTVVPTEVDLMIQAVLGYK